MSKLTKRDLQSALDLLYDVGRGDRTDPFGVEVLDRLGCLVGVHTVGYCETPLPAGYGGYELVSRPVPTPPWLYEKLGHCGQQDPIHAIYCCESTEPIAISDVLTWREFSRTDVYSEVCRGFDTADSLRLYLPAGGNTARFFFFDKKRRGFGARERALLTLLRPHLVLWRRRWGQLRRPAATVALTRRERELVSHLATGATNAEIARVLSISRHTVRKHLENVYKKLGVATRTEAAAASGFQSPSE